jgi:hypothetical protein
LKRKKRFYITWQRRSCYTTPVKEQKAEMIQFYFLLLRSLLLEPVDKIEVSGVSRFSAASMAMRALREAD